MLDKIRQRVDNLIEQDGNEEYLLIRDILDNDCCFEDMDVDTAMSILKKIGYSEEMAKRIYMNIIVNRRM